jgi:cyanate lyase
MKPLTNTEIDQAIADLESQRPHSPKDNRDPRLHWDGVTDATGAVLCFKNPISNDHIVLSAKETHSVSALITLDQHQLRELASAAIRASTAMVEWECNQ